MAGIGQSDYQPAQTAAPSSYGRVDSLFGPKTIAPPVKTASGISPNYIETASGISPTYSGSGIYNTPSTSAPAAAAPSFTNTATPNPVSNQVIDSLLNRANTDMGAGADLDRGFQKIRANASLGVARDQQANRARMGSSGTSADDYDARQNAQSQEAQMNAYQTDVKIGLEKERNNVLNTSGQLGLAQGAQQLAQQNQAQNAWYQQQNVALAQQNQKTQNFRTVIDLLNDPSFANSEINQGLAALI